MSATWQDLKARPQPRLLSLPTALHSCNGSMSRILGKPAHICVLAEPAGLVHWPGPKAAFKWTGAQPLFPLARMWLFALTPDLTHRLVSGGAVQSPGRCLLGRAPHAPPAKASNIWIFGHESTFADACVRRAEQDHFRKVCQPNYVNVYRDRGGVMGVVEFDTADDLDRAVRLWQETERLVPFYPVNPETQKPLT